VLEINAVLTLGNAASTAIDTNLVKITAEHGVDITGNDTIGSIVITDDNASDLVREVSVAAKKTLTIGVPVSGTASFVTTLKKTGTGTLVLESDNDPTLAPIIDIGAGTVCLTDPAQALSGANGVIAVGNSATLILDGDFALNAQNLGQAVSIGGSKSKVVIPAGAKVTTTGNAATFTGGAVGWTLDVSGSLTINSTAGSAFASAPSVTVGEDGVLTVGGSTAETVNNLTGNGSVTLTTGLTVAPVAGTPDFEFAGVISSVINATGGLTYEVGAGATTAFTLSGENEYTTDTVVADGTLVLTAGNTISPNSEVELGSAGNASGTLSVTEKNKKVVLQNAITTVGNGTAHAINVPKGITLELTGDLTFAGGTNTPAKTGDGQLILNGTVTDSAGGAFTVNRGTLTIAGTGAEGMAITVNQLGKLGIETNPTTYHPGTGNTITFAQIGATLVADVTSVNKFDGDKTGTPYLTVNGDTDIDTPGATSITRSVYIYLRHEAKVLEKDRFMVLAANADVASLASSEFVVVDKDGNANKNFVVEHYNTAPYTNALLVRAVADEDPTPAEPEEPGPVTPSFTPAYDGANVKLTFTADPTGAAYKIIHTTTGTTVSEGVLSAATAAGTTFTVSIPVNLLPSDSYTVEVAGYTAKPFPVLGTAPTTVPAPTGPANDTAKVISGGALTFTIPAADITTAAAGKALSAWVWLSLADGSKTSTPVLADLVPLAGGGYTVTVSAAKINAALPESATSLVDVSAIYQLTADSTVTGKTKTVTVGTEIKEDEEKPGNGGGCDAGIGGLFALLGATGSVTLLRRKGR
jgi:hypothetical protein